MYKIEITYQSYLHERLSYRLSLLRIDEFFVHYNINRCDSNGWSREDDITGIFEYQMIVTHVDQQKLELFHDNVVPYLKDNGIQYACIKLCHL